MATVFESSLPPNYLEYLELTHLEDVTVDIEPLGDELSIEITVIETHRDNPLSMLLHSDTGIFFSIPSVMDNRGLLIENSHLLTVGEKDEPKPCDLCGSKYKYGRSVVTYHTGEDTNSLFRPVWVGIDCLTHIDKSLEEVSDDLNSTAVSEII